MKPSQYISETEKAVRQLFDGLSFYREILEKDPRPVFVADASPDDEEEWNINLREWYKKNEASISKSLESQREYLGYTFSQGTLAGAILQISCMGISVFSKNTDIPQSCRKFIKPTSKNVRFCVGRYVYGLPVGLIILAARNQYNHWDAPQPRELTINVFERLANSSDRYTDPAFDLSNSKLQTYSHNVVSLLGWKSYESYLEDMKYMLRV